MNQSKSVFSRRELGILLLLAIVQFTNILDFMVVMPLGPQLMRLMEMTPAQFSHVVSSYTFAAGLSGILSAFFIDRFDRKRALLLVYIGFLAGTFSCALAPGYKTLAFTRALTGTFGGVLGALTLAIVGDLIPAERRGRGMGIIMTSFSLAAVLGVPTGLALANAFGWHAPFLLIAGLGLPILIALAFLIPPLRSHIEMASAGRERLLGLFNNLRREKAQALALALMPTLLIGHFTIVPFMSPFLVANVGLTEKDLPYLFFFGGCATFFSMPMTGRLSDRFGSSNIFTLTAIVTTIPIIVITHLPHTALWIALLLCTVFFVISSSRMVPAMSLITEAVHPQWRGGFMSLNSSFQQLSAGIASFIAGFIITRGIDGRLLNFQRAGYLAAFSSLACIFISRRLRPYRGTETSDHQVTAVGELV
ncbi:MAG: MFS transporter [Blastocatellia bacterium]|nr:MFS transporter [Blastocatellia bacterium]